MLYKEFQPAAPLQPYIKCYWVLEDLLNRSCDLERIVPDGRMELIFHYGDPFRRMVDGKLATQPRGIVAGQINAPVFLQPTGAIGMLGVRFHPHGFSSLFGIPATRFSEELFDFSEVRNVSWRHFDEQVAEASSYAKKISILDRHFLALKSSTGSFDFRVGKIARVIKEQNGFFDLTQLASQMNLSARQIERLFKDKVGLGMGQFARIARFQSAVSTKLNQLDLSLADLSQRCGYYDQAHLIKDFKAFSGLSPKRYFQEVHRMADLFTDEI